MKINSEKRLNGLYKVSGYSLFELRRKTKEIKWAVVSGGSQDEITEIFMSRGIYDFFELGVFGNPLSKDEIIQREISSNNFELPALYIGDRRYDHIVSTKYGIDFVFYNKWTEFHDWPTYCKNENIRVIDDLLKLLN